jgi:hypothetical protein
MECGIAADEHSESLNFATDAVIIRLVRQSGEKRAHRSKALGFPAQIRIEPEKSQHFPLASRAVPKSVSYRALSISCAMSI